MIELANVASPSALVVSQDLPGFRSRLGYVPEEAQVYTHLSGLEYLQLVGRLRGMEERLWDPGLKRFRELEARAQ